MIERPLWTDEDELGYQIGDMHGEWCAAKPDQSKNPTPTKPIRRPKQPEKQKKHITKDGKK